MHVNVIDWHITFYICFSAPTAAPQVVTASATGPKTISIDWNSVDCIERNSKITGYTLHYNSTNGTATTTSLPTNNTTYTVTGLTPSTNYSVKMAAINSNGEIGPFTLPIPVKTLSLTSKCMHAMRWSRSTITWWSSPCRGTSSQWHSHPRPWLCPSGRYWWIWCSVTSLPYQSN